MQNEKDTIEKLSRLNRAGFTIAIDDFGVSNASFHHLRLLPVNKIKIDKTFIEHIARNEKEYQIVKSMISLARNLGLTVTAEGVEDREQLALLVQSRCDELQGYLFSKPIPVESIRATTERLKQELAQML